MKQQNKFKKNAVASLLPLLGAHSFVSYDVFFINWLNHRFDGVRINLKVIPTHNQHDVSMEKKSWMVYSQSGYKSIISYLGTKKDFHPHRSHFSRGVCFWDKIRKKLIWTVLMSEHRLLLLVHRLICSLHCQPVPTKVCSRVIRPKTVFHPTRKLHKTQLLPNEWNPQWWK